MLRARTHKDVIRAWPSVAEFARSIGVRPGNARMMFKRGIIPNRYFSATAAAYQEHGFGRLSYANLAEMKRQQLKHKEPTDG
jgi:hypothetical protein